MDIESLCSLCFSLSFALQVECEPEYIMPDFGSNPDIDEKPPMSLRECLEKVKPFIVAYEGIKDQEEWEVIMFNFCEFFLL